MRSSTPLNVKRVHPERHWNKGMIMRQCIRRILNKRRKTRIGVITPEQAKPIQGKTLTMTYYDEDRECVG